jgi:hypothetical protein
MKINVDRASFLTGVLQIQRFKTEINLVISIVLSSLLTVTCFFINKHQKKGRIFAPPIDVDR